MNEKWDQRVRLRGLTRGGPAARAIDRRAALRRLAGAGASASLAACAERGRGRRAGDVPLPEGEIVGLSDGFGHRLPQGFRPEPPADAWQEKRVVIVGGGVAGLGAAYRLKHAGFTDFVLLELEGTLGGTSRAGVSPVSPHPWAAHYLPVPQKENRALVRLLTEMGALVGTDPEGEPIAAEEQLVWEPEERLFFKGRWYEGLYLRAGASPDDLRQLAAFEAEVGRWVAFRDGRGRRAFALPMSLGSDDAEVRALDRLSMADWLSARGFDSPRLRWFVEYACRDDYGSFLADTSAWAGLFYFASRVPRPGEEAEPLLAWPEGNGRIVAHLGRAVAPHVRLGHAVTEIAPSDDGRGHARVDVWAFDRRTRRPVGLRAERVIFAGPQFLARHVVRPYREAPPTHLAAFDYGPWLVANLTLAEHPRGAGFPLAWDNVLYESPSLGYVVATHQSGVSRGPTVLTFYHAFCDADARASRARLLAGGHEVWAELALADLERAHPEIRRRTTRLDVMRWGHAMIRPRVGFVWGGERESAARAQRGIHFAHSDLSGVALFEEAYHHGLRAAEEILVALGRPPAERWA